MKSLQYLMLFALVFMGCSREFTNPYDPGVSPADWVPNQFKLSVESPTSVKLYWSHPGGFKISTIVERQVNNLEYEEVAMTSATEYVDSTLIPDRTYSFRVRAAIEDRSSDPTPTIKVVWSEKGTVLWETALKGGASAADLSPNGKSITIGDQKGYAHVIATSDGTEIWNKKLDDTGEGTTIDDLHFSYDNKNIAYGLWGSNINEVGVVSASDGSKKWSNQQEKQVVAVRFSHNNGKVASGGYDKRLRMWNASSGSELWNGYHTNFVEKVLFTEDDEYVYSASWDNSIKKFSVADGSEIWTASHNAEVWDIALSPDENRIVSGSSDKTVRAWDTSSGSQIWSESTPNSVMTVACSPDGQWIASGCTDEVKVWNVADGAVIYDLDHPSFMHQVEFSPDGKFLASCGRDGVLRIWDLDDGSEYWQSSFSDDAEFLEFSSDGQYIFCADRGGTLRYFLVDGSWVITDE